MAYPIKRIANIQARGIENTTHNTRQTIRPQVFGKKKFNSSNTSTMVAIKGEEIRFIAGKYGGKTGWINTQEPADESITPVIVNLGRKGEKATFVYTSSIKRNTSAPPTSYAQAVIQQCPDIEKNLVTVTRQLAKCDISRDPKGFQAVVHNQLDEARAWQEGKGSKAMYRKINF